MVGPQFCRVLVSQNDSPVDKLDHLPTPSQTCEWTH